MEICYAFLGLTLMKVLLTIWLGIILNACASKCPDFTGSPNTPYETLRCHAKHDDSHAQFLLGLHHERLGEMKEAIRYYVRAAETRYPRRRPVHLRPLDNELGALMIPMDTPAPIPGSANAKHALKRLHRQGYDVPKEYHDPPETDFDKS